MSFLGRNTDQPDEPAADVATGARLIPRITIQAFCEHSQTAQLVEAAIHDRRMSKVALTVHNGGIEGAIETYKSNPTPNLILVETSLPAWNPSAHRQLSATGVASSTDTADQRAEVRRAGPPSAPHAAAAHHPRADLVDHAGRQDIEGHVGRRDCGDHRSDVAVGVGGRSDAEPLDGRPKPGGELPGDVVVDVEQFGLTDRLTIMLQTTGAPGGTE